MDAFSRRKFLGLAGVAGALPRGPVRSVIDGIAQGLIREAEAAAGTPPKNFVYVYLGNGVPRWYFDLVLKTAKNDPKYAQSPHVATRFTNGAPTYDTVTSPAGPHGTYELPSLWASSIPTASGGTAPMTSLLPYLFSLRGVTNLGDGHPGGAYKQLQPSSSGPSLNGIVADASSRAVPAIIDPFTGLAPAYRSRSGVGAQSFFYGNSVDPLSQLLSPFDRTKDTASAAYLTRRQAMGDAINQGLATLADYAGSRQPGAQNLFQMRGNAEKLLFQGLGDLSTAYPTLLAKYTALIQACAAGARAGVTDAAIAPGALPTSVKDPLSGKSVSVMDPKTGTNQMLWSGTETGSIAVGNADLRSLIGSTAVLGGLAEGFATAEYMLLNGYSSTAVIGIQRVVGMAYQNTQGVVGNVADISKVNQYASDEHTGGTAVSLVINSFLFQSLAACIYEFMTRLQGRGMWESTVLNIGSEFSRSAKMSCSGSDHSWQGNVTTLFSGAIQGPLFVGNTTIENDGGYSGSFGKGAAVAGFEGGIQPMIGNAASTVAAILGVPSPGPNNFPVATIDAAGRLQPAIGLENV